MTVAATPIDAPAVLRFSIGLNVSPSAGRPHDHEPAEMTLDELAERLASPTEGPKGSGGFYLVARFAPGKRGKADAIEAPALVMVDLDFGAWTTDTIRAAIPEPIAWIAHTTASHTLAAPKWRVVFPLGVALDPADWTRLARAISRWFGMDEGAKGFDRCGEKIAQPIYWPTRATPDAPFSADGDIESAPMPKEIAERLIADERSREAAAAEEARKEREAREAARRARAARFGTNDRADVIAAWNEAHGIEPTMVRYGYTLARVPGGRALAPNSSKGIPAVRVWPDEGRFHSHHACDAGTEFEHGDAFDLFRLFEHGGDWSKAIRAAAVELGISHGNTTTNEAATDQDDTPGDDAGELDEERDDGSANFRGERGTAEGVAFEPLAAIESRELASFPVDALGKVGDFVRALAATTQTPPDLAGVAALGFLAGAVARKAIVRAGWDEEIALYVAAVAEPGSRKSEVWKQCARPVEACESELREAAAPIIRENEAKLALLKKRLGKIETNYANAEDAEGRREAEREAIELRAEIAAVSTAGAPRLLVADVTPERLATLVAQNEERMILASAEGGQIFDRMFRYSQNGDPNMDLVLSGWSGERCTIDRQNAEPVIMKRPVLTIVGAIQQHVLESLARQTAFEGRGLTARFAYSIPRDNRGYRDTRAVVPMDRVAAQQYAQTMDRLLQMEHVLESPLVLAVVGEALERFNDFREVVEIEQREGGRFEDVRGWASKAPGLVLRIAGVLALADARWGARPAISPEIMRRAIDLGDYFADHSKRAFEIMAGDTGDRALDKLWRWISRRETPGADFTRQEAWQGTKGGRFKVGADLDGPLDRLARAGRIARRPASKESAGRRAAVWAVNPEAPR